MRLLTPGTPETCSLTQKAGRMDVGILTPETTPTRTPTPVSTELLPTRRRQVIRTYSKKRTFSSSTEGASSTAEPAAKRQNTAAEGRKDKPEAGPAQGVSSPGEQRMGILRYFQPKAAAPAPAPAPAPDSTEAAPKRRRQKRRLVIRPDHDDDDDDVDVEKNMDANDDRRQTTSTGGTTAANAVQTTLNLAMAGSSNDAIKECKECNILFNPIHEKDVKFHARYHAAYCRKKRQDDKDRE